jgi:hypothetical protein
MRLSGQARALAGARGKRAAVGVPSPCASLGDRGRRARRGKEVEPAVQCLAGQVHGYLLKTMTDFRDHARANNPGMSDLMNTGTPEQLAAMPNYLAGL